MPLPVLWLAVDPPALVEREGPYVATATRPVSLLRVCTLADIPHARYAGFPRARGFRPIPSANRQGSGVWVDAHHVKQSDRFTCFICGFPLSIDDLDSSCSGCNFPLRPEDFGLSVSKLRQLRSQLADALHRFLLASRQTGPMA